MENTSTTNASVQKRGRGRPATYGWNTLLKNGDNLFISNPKPSVPSSAFSWAKRRGFTVSTTSAIEGELKGLRITRTS